MKRKSCKGNQKTAIHTIIDMILGKDLILTVGVYGMTTYLTPLAASNSCQLSLSTDFIESLNPFSRNWKESIPTYNSWSVSAGTLLARTNDFEKLRTYHKNNVALRLCIHDRDWTVFYSGKAYISEISMTCNTGSLCKIDIQFQTSGPLTSPETEYLVMSSMPILSDRHMQFNQDGTITIIDDLPTQIYIKEVDSTLIDRTKFIALHQHMVVVAASQADTTTILSNVDSASLNEIVVLNSVANGDYVNVGPGKYTILMNMVDEAPDGNDDIEYIQYK